MTCKGIKVRITSNISSEIMQARRDWSERFKVFKEGFPGGTVVEGLPANAGDTGSSPGLGGSHMLRSN